MKKILLIALALFLFGCFINLVDRYGMVCIIVIAVLGLLLLLAKKKGLIKWPVSQPKKEDRTLKEETFYAVGVSYYENNIRKLAYRNPDWSLTAQQVVERGRVGRKIFKHNYVNRPVKLQIETNNPHDKNAVSVVIAGELVGYIGRDENIHVRDVLNHREIISLSGFIGGGDYKIVSEDGEVYRDTSAFSVNVRLKYI